MKGNGFRLLKTDIQHEVENLRQLQREMEELLAILKGSPSRVELRAMGSVLHDFYSGIEKIFERIASELDGGVPEGQQWHMQLLTRMASKTAKVRPAVIDRALHNKLADYLSFGIFSAMPTALNWNGKSCSLWPKSCPRCRAVSKTICRNSMNTSIP